MCVRREDRTLNEPCSQLIYQIIEENDLCKYVTDEQFLSFLCSIIQFSNDAPNDDGRFLQFVDLLTKIVTDLKWNNLRLIAYTKLLPLLEKNKFLKNIDYADKPNTTYHQLLFHVGMLGFDYKKANEK
jgi:hypothetical protein